MKDSGDEKDHIDAQQIAASDLLTQVITQNINNDIITFNELKSSLSERSFGFLLLVFSLPIIVVPPGLTMLACIPVSLISIQMFLGYHTPWLPSWLGNRSIKRKTLASIIEKVSPVLYKIERVTRARLYFISSRNGEKVFGAFASLYSLSIAVPLPLTNLLPAIGIALMSIGLISRDGLLIILGMIVGLVGCIITFSILIFGAAVISGLYNSIF